MSIRHYLDVQIGQAALAETNLRLLDRYHTRILYNAEGLASEINKLIWPHGAWDEQRSSAHTIYALIGSFSEEQIGDYGNSRRSLTFASGNDSYSDALVLTQPLRDITSGGWVLSHRFKRAIYALNPNPENLPLDVLRAIHQVLAYSVLKDGGYIFHASGVEHIGRALLFIGECGAGKTTLSLAAAKKGFKYITNDVAVLRKSDHGWTVQGGCARNSVESW